MDVNAPTPSSEVKSEGFSSKTKRTYVIGVVDTTGMKSANANRKRRWDQPPNEEGDSVPPKVIVREAEGDSTQLDPKLLGVVAEGMQDSSEDYDSQYEECVGASKVDPDSSVDEPALEDVKTAPVSGFDIPISKVADESVMDSRLECPEKLSLVDDAKPGNTLPLPGIECLPSPPKEIEGSIDHCKVSTATVKDKVNEELEKDVKSAGKIEEKIVTKPAEAIPVTGIISDSLKQIQFCYDEDSNSTDESEVETKIVVGDKTDVEMVAKKEDNIIDEQLSEQIAPTDATINPSGIEATKDTRRSPTPVLSEEQDENLVSETAVTQKESIAIFECKTDNDGVIASHSVTDTNEEIHYDKPVNTNVESVSEKESCSVELTELNSENSVGEADGQVKVASSLTEQGITSEPLKDSAIVQYQEHQPKDKLSHSGGKTTPLVHASDKTLPEIKQDFVSPAILTADVGQLEANVLCNEVSLKPSESQQPNNEAISQGDPSGSIDAVKETKITYKSSNAKPANDPTECNSETSLSKDMKILMEDSSEKYPSVNDHKLPGKNTGRTNLVSMDNSQNCVGFDDLNSLEKVISKSPELDLRYSDSEEDVQFSSSEVTMHFASFRTPENATNTKPERDIEDAKEESAKALDALIAENSERDIEDKEESAKALDALIAENPEGDIEDKEESAKALDALIAENPERDIEDKDESAKALDALIAENPERDIEDAKEESAKALDALIEENPERDIEDKEESAKALDALIAENPDLGDKEVQFQEPASSIDGNTMEMLDSLVRRSSEDDPSRVQLGEGMLSEDSLINEINQLPDDSLTNEINQLPDKEDDDKKTGPDKNLEDSSVPVVKSTSPDSKRELKTPSKDGVEAEAVHDEPKKSKVAINPDISENVSTDLSYSKVDTPGEIKSKPGDHRNMEKSEGGTSVEDELSQGGEEEPKNMNVSSENIIEVIFGSKQENSIHTIRSMERDGDSKVIEKSDGDVMITEDSLAVDVQPKTSSYSNSAQKSVDDSKLQLNNEEIEIDNTEIVMVDPTKPLSGEDSDNDADEGPSNKDALTNKEAEVNLTPPPEVVVAPVDDGPIPQSNSSSELTAQSIPYSKAVEEEGSLMEVEESNSLDTLIIETATVEPMDVDKKTELPPVVSVDNSAEMKTKKQEKATPVNEGSHTREPSVPVLIIKKQALPSKKDGDKKVVETLLTCSPKSADNLVSDRAPTPPHKKVHNEALQIDTAPESTTASFSPKHSPITLRIYKDNLTVKTDLDSPKRNKSPMSSEFKSELSPKVRSPGVSENLSPQNKQLEFTLKIAKDAHTNYPKATMSPKNVSSPNSVWKSEVQIADSPNVTNKDEQDVKQVKQSVPPRGRGRGRGRGATPKRGSLGRGRRGGFRGRISSGVDESSKTSLETAEASSSSLGVPDVVIKQEVLTEDEKSDSSSVGAPIQMHDMFKKMINKEAEGSGTPDKPIHSEILTSRMIDTPIARKRGRPRKSIQTPIVVPEELVIVKQEPITPVETTTPVIDGGDGDDGSSSTGRPKRTCRGRTKPIVVKKRKPRGGGAAGASVPRCDSTPLPPIQIKEENVTTPATASATTEATTPESITLPAVTPSPPVDKPAVAPTPPARGRGGFKRPTPDRNTLSEKELAELQKIEAKKEKLRLDRIAKYEAKKAKKLAKKLKDEERRKRLAREKAEKAEAAAPQVFEEETRMSAPDSSCTGQTPGPHRILTGDGLLDESQNSISTPGDTNKGNKKGRMEISITDMDCLVKEVRVDELAEYQWQGSELFMIQEQISLYLGVKSFKRKYPGLKRRPVEAEERTFLEDSGLVPKSMCDLGLTAVGSAEILDIMFQDFPEKYEEFRKHVRDKQAREASFRQKAAIGLQKKDGTKVEPREQALEAVAAWNANLNRERREERRCALDLQTFTVHYPKLDRENMKKHVPKVGLYPVAVIPGQFCDHYKKYTPNELMYFPVNTVLYGPLRPNERQKDNGSDDGSGSESSSSSSSSSSSGDSSSESESEGEEPAKCKLCSGTKKKNKDGIAEVLLTCVQCKSCYHPTCKEFTSEMIIHLTKYEWQCTACKKCSKCRDPNLKDRIMCCQLCDRGYHLSCIGLKKMPEGRWHCTVCAYCSSCGSRNPGGSDWQHEFKKGEKGIKIYQRTLCTPCFKLWRKGKYCQLCSKCHSVKPEEDPSLIQCNSCDRWLHKDCYGSKYGLTNKLMSTSSIQCDFCVERITLGSHGMNRSLIKV